MHQKITENLSDLPFGAQPFRRFGLLINSTKTFIAFNSNIAYNKYKHLNTRMHTKIAIVEVKDKDTAKRTLRSQVKQPVYVAFYEMNQ